MENTSTVIGWMMELAKYKPRLSALMQSEIQFFNNSAKAGFKAVTQKANELAS